MNEAEWFACTNLDQLVEELYARLTHERKLRLFACACCRFIDHLLPDQTIRDGLTRAERFLDGQVRNSTLETWYRKVRDVRDAQPRVNGDLSASWHACNAVENAVAPQPLVAFLYAQVSARDALGRAKGIWTWPKFQRARQRIALELIPYFHDIVGNPFRAASIKTDWLSWQDRTVVKLAQAAIDERQLPGGLLEVNRLYLLADAIEEAGCPDPELLGHLRGPGPHVKGCWVLDLLLGKQPGL